MPAWPAAGAAVEAGRRRRSGRAAEAGAAAPTGLLALNTGELDLEELDLVLGVLPIDFQYVDEHDKVRFYSERHRIFPRSRASSGARCRTATRRRACTRCRRSSTRSAPARRTRRSSGSRCGGKFLHIRYFAVSDGGGDYRGVVEMVQDVTAIRALEGQRRLLDW